MNRHLRALAAFLKRAISRHLAALRWRSPPSMRLCGAPASDGSSKHEQRRLAATLVADVVGYSKLVGTDEAGTLARPQQLDKTSFGKFDRKVLREKCAAI